MKHRNKILYLLLPLFCVSCSDVMDIHDFDKNGMRMPRNSYIDLVLNVPDGGNVTRTGDNNADLEHGAEDEYTVHNAYLLLFEQDKYESGALVEPKQFDATFCNCFRVMGLERASEQIPHISRRYIIRNLELWEFEPDDDKYYFGVILANIDAPNAIRPDFINHKISFLQSDGTFRTIKAEDNFSYGALKNEIMMPMIGNRNFLSIKETENGETKTYLMMSNAMLFPISSVSPIKKGIIEAVNLTGKIKPKPTTDPEYVDETWPQFYLERLAAKVEVTAKDSNNNSTVNGSLSIGGTTYNYELKQWCLANVSPNNYVMRHGDNEWAKAKYTTNSNSSSVVSKENRFTSYSHIESTSTPNNSEMEVGQFFRGYFCESTEYLKCTRSIWGNPEPKYDGSEGSEYSKVEEVPAANHYGGNFFAQRWHSFGDIDYCHENTMKVWRMMVKYATHVVVEVKFWTGDTEPKDGTETATFSIGGKTYTNGRAYYILPISHFGNQYTPWNDGETPTPLPIALPYTNANAADRLVQEQANIVLSYPCCRDYLSDETITPDQEGHMSPADGNYLGRWGVVRNTWYKLNITGVVGIGMNENPLSNDGKIITEDPTPLDYYENLLKCTVTVKDWTVRDQSITLQ